MGARGYPPFLIGRALSINDFIDSLALPVKLIGAGVGLVLVVMILRGGWKK